MNPLNECFESISRRSFLRASAILTFAALPDFAFGAEVKNGRLLVILLRGGMDGLFAMPAVGDPGLQGLRKDLMPDGLLKVDGLFALHPALQHVHELYTGGQALLVHGVSYPYTGRSHFEGQDIMESGVLQAYSSPTGWLGRALDASGYTAVAMSLPVPLILRGKTPTESRYPTWISSPPQSVYQQLGVLWANDASLAPVGAQLVATSGSLQMDTSLRWAMKRTSRPSRNRRLCGYAKTTARALPCWTTSVSIRTPNSRASIRTSCETSIRPSEPFTRVSEKTSGRTRWS